MNFSQDEKLLLFGIVTLVLWSMAGCLIVEYIKLRRRDKLEQEYQKHIRRCERRRRRLNLLISHQNWQEVFYLIEKGYYNGKNK